MAERDASADNKNAEQWNLEDNVLMDLEHIWRAPVEELRRDPEIWSMYERGWCDALQGYLAGKFCPGDEPEGDLLRHPGHYGGTARRYDAVTRQLMRVFDRDLLIRLGMTSLESESDDQLTLADRFRASKPFEPDDTNSSDSERPLNREVAASQSRSAAERDLNDAGRRTKATETATVHVAISEFVPEAASDVDPKRVFEAVPKTAPGVVPKAASEILPEASSEASTENVLETDFEDAPVVCSGQIFRKDKRCC